MVQLASTRSGSFCSSVDSTGSMRNGQHELRQAKPHVTSGALAARTVEESCGIPSDLVDKHLTSMRTTVMLRNLPFGITREILLAILDAEGFASRYDFVYLPIDFRAHHAAGYAFLNL